MSEKIWNHGEDLITANRKGVRLITELKDTHGTRCVPYLISLLDDEDAPWQSETVFRNFALTTLVRATYKLRVRRVVVNVDFLKRLENECFWRLTRNQMIRLQDEILYLYPQRFEFLNRWISEGL